MKDQQSGFTLIELVIVIVLLGILTAVIAPKFVDIQSNARQAIVDAGVGAVKSAALIQFAANQGVPVTGAVSGLIPTSMARSSLTPLPSCVTLPVVATRPSRLSTSTIQAITARARYRTKSVTFDFDWHAIKGAFGPSLAFRAGQ